MNDALKEYCAGHYEKGPLLRVQTTDLHPGHSSEIFKKPLSVFNFNRSLDETVPGIAYYYRVMQFVEL